MNTAFLYLCAAISLFITISGIANAHQAADILIHLAFAPVTAYLLSKSILHLLNSKHITHVSITAHPWTTLGIIFILSIVAIAEFISIIFMTT